MFQNCKEHYTPAETNTPTERPAIHSEADLLQHACILHLHLDKNI